MTRTVSVANITWRERLVAQILEQLNPRQYAREGHSTTDALIYILQVIHGATDRGNVVCRLLKGFWPNWPFNSSQGVGVFRSVLRGSLHDLMMWPSFGKHENSSFLKNFVSASWKSILKLGNLRIFSRIYQKQRLQRPSKVGSICMR